MTSKRALFQLSEPYDDNPLTYSSADERGDFANSYLAQGEKALLKGDIIGLEFFEKAIELDPNNPDLFYRQGLALFEYGSSEGKEKALLIAAKKFKNTTFISPCHFEAWHAWGNALSLLGSTYKEHHYFLEAEEKLKKALQLVAERKHPLTSELHWDYGKVLYQIAKNSGEAIDLQTALDAFQKSSVEHEPLPQEFWNDFGLTCLAMADRINDPRYIVKAINCFKQAVSLTLSSFDGWLLLARSMNELYTHTHDEDHFTQSHECFASAAALRPYSLDLWHEWAVFLLESARRTRDLKRLRSCLEKCQRGYVFNAKHPQLLAIWAEALALMGELTDRIDLLYEGQNKITEALDISNEEDPDIWHSYGNCLFSWGVYFEDLDYYYQAIEKFQEGISLDRTRHQDWYAIAKTYAAVGDADDDIDAFEKAVRFYAKAVDLKPRSSYYFEYALALSSLGEMKRDQTVLRQAQAFFEYTLQVQKNALYIHPEWLYHYAVTLDLLGDCNVDENMYQKALEMLSQVLMIDPDFPLIHYRIGLVYSHLGEAIGESDYFHRAIHHYRLALKHEEEYDFAILEWGTTLINIGQHTFDKDVADQCHREAEHKLIQAARLGNQQAFYQLGCLYSLLTQYDKSLYYIQKSHEVKSLPLLEDLMEDDWLEGLRLTAPFQEFLSHLHHG
jgi:tetratricopeptide (TPR) repeat protein